MWNDTPGRDNCACAIVSLDGSRSGNSKRTPWVGQVAVQASRCASLRLIHPTCRVRCERYTLLCATAAFGKLFAFWYRPGLLWSSHPSGTVLCSPLRSQCSSYSSEDNFLRFDAAFAPRVPRQINSSMCCDGIRSAPTDGSTGAVLRFFVFDSSHMQSEM